MPSTQDKIKKTVQHKVQRRQNFLFLHLIYPLARREEVQVPLLIISPLSVNHDSLPYLLSTSNSSLCKPP